MNISIFGKKFLKQKSLISPRRLLKPTTEEYFSSRDNKTVATSPDGVLKVVISKEKLLVTLYSAVDPNIVAEICEKARHQNAISQTCEEARHHDPIAETYQQTTQETKKLRLANKRKLSFVIAGGIISLMFLRSKNKRLINKRLISA